MREYEMIREIFNQCSGNQMRDVFFSEIETDDPEAVARSYCEGKETEFTRTDRPDGSVVFDFVTDGLRQRITFS
ncbi:MAG: hypothetical protein IKQ73_00915 [Oscillospiraceae bacterium]|jgi:hypothetical protein|nr:hypothetical protein [Oscillospiraceae bacterium]MBR6951975.1 hypothetical protein [Oscillospiraceae bacterium]MCR5174140.1 hypothetical protein [Oscillospiraceae bacterium]